MEGYLNIPQKTCHGLSKLALGSLLKLAIIAARICSTLFMYDWLALRDSTQGFCYSMMDAPRFLARSTISTLAKFSLL